MSLFIRRTVSIQGAMRSGDLAMGGLNLPFSLLALSFKDSTFDGSLVKGFLQDERSLDIIDLLAVAQYTKTDFLPITWDSHRGSIGRGASGIINQLQVNIQSAFAFKRFLTGSHFRLLESEMRILQSPSIRSHPNVVDLEGICWDVDDMSGTISPVLVFPKAEHGDLNSYLTVQRRKLVSFDEKITWCVQIAQAIDVLHRSSMNSHHFENYHFANLPKDIVHGDLKPHNVLMYESSENSRVAKVTDFAYSCLGSNDTSIVRVPCSRPFEAPEWHPRGFPIAKAKKMDIYSLGLLCAWILVADMLPHLESQLHFPSQDQTNIEQTDRVKPAEDLLQELKDGHLLLEYIHRAIAQVFSEDKFRCNTLQDFFSKTLCDNPDEREQHIGSLLACLNGLE